MSEHECKAARWAYDIRRHLFTQRCAGCGRVMARWTEAQVLTFPADYPASIRRMLGL